MTTVAASGDTSEAGRVTSARSSGRPSSAVWDLLLFQTVALTLQLVAVTMAWSDAGSQANVVSCAAMAFTFTSALWALTRPQLDRALRNAAVACLGITTTVQWRMIDPLLFRGYDEQLHMRTLTDIEASHTLFQPHPLLAVSPRYPGLEALAAFFDQLGLPVMIAATAVVLLARLALVLTLCAAVEHLTGNVRAGGLAVAVYAISPQFVFFNSQFAYQTLSLPFALAAVAFVARARWAENAKPLFGGAVTCLLAVALTHHLTSLLTAGFLIAWTLVEDKGQARRRVFCGAVVAVLATAFWATVQWSLLRDYFGPMIDDVVLQMTNGVQRSPFAETAADPKPAWERMLLLYYVVIVTLTVSVLIVSCGRSMFRRHHAASRHESAVSEDGRPPRWEPRTVLVLMTATIPVLFAARVMPRWGEVGDRASTFLYLPFSLLVVGCAMNWKRSGRHVRAPRWTRMFVPPVRAGSRHGWLIRPLVLTLGTAAFLGGYLLGSGSEWARLPGGYLPGADGRSMDAETMAAVRWARDEIPAGSRIGADRLSSTLLASQARLWPVLSHDDSPEVAFLYKSDNWGVEQSDIVRGKKLQYLYVDRRFAGAVPLVGTYFDESPALKLTHPELTKFDSVPGIREVYRHGPISIYDLSGLGVSDVRSGWFGQARTLRTSTQAVVGLLLGVALAAVGRTDVGKAGGALVRSIRAAAGPLLSFTFGLAALCIVSVLMLLSRIWLGPAFFVAAALAVILVNPHWAIQLSRSAVNSFRWRWFAAIGSLVLAIAAAIMLSALHASSARQLPAEKRATVSAAAESGFNHDNVCALRCSSRTKGSVE
jgi:hypothetical protein